MLGGLNTCKAKCLPYEREKKIICHQMILKEKKEKKLRKEKTEKKKLWKCICNWPLLPSGKQNIGHLLVLNNTLHFLFLIIAKKKKIKFSKFYVYII